MIVRQRTAVVVALLTLLTLLAGCNGPPKPQVVPDPTEPAPTRSVAAMPSQAEVDAVLLSPAEIPNGPYQASTQQVGDAASLNTSLPQCAESAPIPDPKVISTAVYQGPTVTGPFLAETITVTSLPVATQLIKDLDRVQANCAEFGGTMPGGIDLTVNIMPLTMPQIGDATKAFRLNASVPNAGVAVYAHLIVARIGNVLVQLALMQYVSPTIEETRALAELAVKKAAGLRLS